MAAYTAPKRRVSSNTTLSVSNATLPWVPNISDNVGRFNNVTRADNGGIHTMDSPGINPDFYNADGTSRTLYRNLWTFAAGTGSSNIKDVLESEGGGTFAPLLGAKGSMLMYNGGHYSIDAPAMWRFDISEGKWSIYDYPIYASVDKTIDPQGSLATLSGTVVKRGFGTSPTAAWDRPNTTGSTNPFQEDTVSVNNRVSRTGNYVKYADGTPIPGAGDTEGVGATVFHPYPIHTYAGVCYVPPAGGGGTLGSFALATHSQTGVAINEPYYGVYVFDIATKVWSFIPGKGTWANLLPNQSLKNVGLEFDSGRNLLWYFGGGNFSPIAFDLKQLPVRFHNISGSSWKPANIGSSPCYMPSRNLMVYIKCADTFNPAPPAGDGAQNNSLRVPLLFAFSLVGYNFQQAFTYVERHLICSPLDGATYKAHLDDGTDTGWPGWKSIASGTWPAAASANTVNGATDGWDLMADYYLKNPSGTSRGGNDRMEYCEAEDCLFFVSKHLGTDNGYTRASQHTINLWKLYPPPIGQEFTGTWTWVKEVIQETAGCGGAAFKVVNQPAWGGKTKYIPAIKCVTYVDAVNFPVQAIRSKNWT